MCAIARLAFSIPAFSSIILAAHFLREQSLVLAGVSLLGIPLLFLRERWIVRAMQVFFLLATAEWIHTTVELVKERMAVGMPWGRMLLILSTVAALTLVSGWLVSKRGLKRSSSAAKLIPHPDEMSDAR